MAWIAEVTPGRRAATQVPAANAPWLTCLEMHVPIAARARGQLDTLVAADPAVTAWVWPAAMTGVARMNANATMTRSRSDSRARRSTQQPTWPWAAWEPSTSKRCVLEICRDKLGHAPWSAHGASRVPTTTSKKESKAVAERSARALMRVPSHACGPISLRKDCFQSRESASE